MHRRLSKFQKVKVMTPTFHICACARTRGTAVRSLQITKRVLVSCWVGKRENTRRAKIVIALVTVMEKCSVQLFLI